MVGHGKSPRDAVGAHVGNVLVTIGCDHALQSNVAIFDDDVNGGHGAESIALHHRVVVDGVENGPANSVIIGRKWQYFDIVDDLRYAFDVFHGIPRVVLESWSDNLPHKRHFGTLDLVFEIVEDTEIRQQREFV